MTIAIQDFRLSFVWVSTLLAQRPGKPALFTERASYEQLFNAVQKNGEPKEFGPPWPVDKPYAHRFWCNYLNTANPALVDGSTGWAKAVPLRGRERVVALSLGDFPGRIAIEHYFHPFGLAFVLTFSGSGSFNATDWVSLAQSTSVGQFEATFPNEPSKKLPLKGLAGEVLSRMQGMYFAPGMPTAAALEPFTIMTVIRAEGVDENIAPAEGEEIHRLLFGAATLRKNWKSANLKAASLADSLLAITKGASPGDVVFASSRGRAIWIPSAFSHLTSVDLSGKPVNSQSCYHRNQVFAALQVESLCGLAREVSSRVKDAALPQRLEQLGEIAASALGDFDVGMNTYRSMSLRRQIKDRGSQPDIALLRKRYGL